MGQTKRSLRVRWNSHVSSSQCKRWKGYLGRAIEKYGRHAFAKRIIDVALSKEMADVLEVFHIGNLRSTNSDVGYNLTFGGNGSLGHKKTAEEIQRISSKQIGKFVSEETRKKQSLAKKGKAPPNKGGKSLLRNKAKTKSC